MDQVFNQLLEASRAVSSQVIQAPKGDFDNVVTLHFNKHGQAIIGEIVSTKKVDPIDEQVNFELKKLKEALDKEDYATVARISNRIYNLKIDGRNKESQVVSEWEKHMNLGEPRH
jgi:hypothetical protein